MPVNLRFQLRVLLSQIGPEAGFMDLRFICEA